MLSAFLYLFAVASAAWAALPTGNNCGIPSVTPNTGRIVGGEEARPYSWPWQVQVRYYNSHSCGASLISEDFILCAAHCFQGTSDRGYSFRVGRYSTSGSNEPYEQSASVKRVFNHESYNPSTTLNDIAIIQVTPPFKFNEYVKPVCLPSRTTTLDNGATVYVSGWGTLSSGGKLPKNLMQVKLPIIDRTTCNGRSYYNGAIKPGMICAGFAAGGKDSCQGDSGGPMVAKIGNRWEQYGVVSWGAGCASPNRPGVYSDTVYFDTWIRQKVAQVEREEAEVANKFKPIPFGAAFRELAKDLVEADEIDDADMDGQPNADAWI